MIGNEYFIESLKLQRSLSKDEIYSLLLDVKNGNNDAKNTLIEGNIKLVLYEVVKHFSGFPYDKKDLVQEGIFGLMKAIESFDVTKNIEFSTYAVRCIDNEIFLFLRRQRKNSEVDSLDDLIGDEFKLGDKLSCNYDLEDLIIESDLYGYINELVDSLGDIDKEIIKLSFGFYDNKKYTQEEIADILGVSRTWVTKRRTKTLKRIGNILKQRNYIEDNLLDKYDSDKKILKRK